MIRNCEEILRIVNACKADKRYSRILKSLEVNYRQ